MFRRPPEPKTAFRERRWERWHLNGWVGVVEQAVSGLYRGYAQDALGRRSATVHENTDFEAVKAAVDALLLGLAPHECACLDWQELR